MITGAPGAGKTALIEVLALRGWRTVPEVARAILRQSGGMALRVSDPMEFGAAMLEREIAGLEGVKDDGTWTIFDRGIGDSLGFFELSGLQPPSLFVHRAAALRYSGPIFAAPAWADIFCSDDERTQDWDEAVASGEAVKRTWRDAGYFPIDLPLATPELRADFVEARLTA